MFQKIESTQFPPKEKPVLVWDGQCGFCKYWVLRWKKISNDKIIFKPYQEVAEQFPDITLKEFKKASRLITTTGNVHSGPDSAYMSYKIAKPNSPWHYWYTRYKWFEKLSDWGYNNIAKNRSTMFKITKVVLGDNPLHFKHYWILYLLGVVFLLTIVLNVL